MSRKKLIVCVVLGIVGGVFCWFLPLFHVRPLGKSPTEAQADFPSPGMLGAADPVAYVDAIWDGPLRTSDSSVEITRLWDAFEFDATQARSQYGRQAGLGGAWYFRVRGQGTVESLEGNRCILTVDNSLRRVCIELGVVVDNTVREAIGVAVSNFANSQEFNTVSRELNRRVEREIIAPIRTLLKPGVVVEFVGAAKVGGDSDLNPLYLIPIRLEVQREANDVASIDATSGATSP